MSSVLNGASPWRRHRNRLVGSGGDPAVRWMWVNWYEFEAAAPDLAATARELLVDADVALIGTLRRDGAPRISCVQPCILDGVLYLGMMWRSRKAVDLVRDPRLVLHNAVCSSTGAEVELSLAGRARAVTEPSLRRRYVRAVEKRTTWTEPHFHLFAVEIRGGGLVTYAHGEQVVRVWPQGVELRRAYS